MNWKQTIGLVLAVGLIVGFSFAFIFPALYDVDRSGAPEELGAGQAGSSVEEGRGVLPKLKGVRWKSPKKKAPEKKADENTAAEKKAPEKTIETAERKRVREEFEAPAGGASGKGGEAPEEAGKPSGEALLELQEMSWYEQGGYAVVTGSVKNVSGRSMPSVLVHARFLDEDGNPLVAGDSLIDLNPIFPGQVSTFSVAARFNPAMKDAKLDFTLFSGEPIPWSKLETETEGEGEGSEPTAEGVTEGEPAPEREGLPPVDAYPPRR
jgi:hypothetical protein